jgi:hypothetical protein
MNRYLHRVSKVQLNNAHGQLLENVKSMIGLLMLLLIVNTFKKIRTVYRGGGNSLSINGESIEIPAGFEMTVQEAFTSLQKVLTKRGGRKTRRR